MMKKYIKEEEAILYKDLYKKPIGIGSAYEAKDGSFITVTDIKIRVSAVSPAKAQTVLITYNYSTLNGKSGVETVTIQNFIENLVN